MKKIIVVIMVLLASTVFAADPYIVTNPQEGVIGYTLGGLTEQTIAAQQDGSLLYNVRNAPIGTTEVTIAACNLWGDCGASVPFVLKRIVPGPPVGTRFEVR